MAPFFLMEKAKSQKTDSVILALTLFLTVFGLVILFSASYFEGEKLMKNPYYFVLWQSLWAVFGLAGAYVLSRLDLSLLNKALPWLIAASMVLMVLPLLPGIGRDILGARRWIFIAKLSFQPSELARVVFILYLAYILAKKDFLIGQKPRDTMAPPLLILAGFTFLSLAQNDFSTAVFFLLIASAFFLVAGLQMRYFAPLAFFGLSLFFINLFSKDYRIIRVMTLLNPTQDPQGAGYQVLASQKALVEGGLWGVGLGSGERKLGRLPEVHNDFVFAVVGEEMGFIGVLAIIGLFALLYWRAMEVAKKAADKFGFYLVFGISFSLAIQVLLNMGVVVGILPATGIPLPFFSAGGTALLMTLWSLGLVLNVSRTAQGRLP